jgi:hypothetical protein
MITVIFIYLVMLSISFVLKEKLGLDYLLMSSKYEIVYKLGKCDFCFNFWIAVIVTIVYHFLSEVFFLMPFAIMGFWILVNKILRNE